MLEHGGSKGIVIRLGKISFLLLEILLFRRVLISQGLHWQLPNNSFGRDLQSCLIIQEEPEIPNKKNK